MCGIVGIVNYKEDISENKEIIKDMANEIEKRGPDEFGFFYSKHVCFAHKRLSIVDIENGKQPMTTYFSETEYSITYNGQLYNCEELRDDLIKKGFKFYGHSDTEVLLKAYIAYGEDVCKYLNGIFAFAIWNDKKEELFMARDHFGIKPLYYSIVDDELIFASEVKAILKYPKIKPVLDKQGIEELFGIGPCHSPGISPFKNILELKPATFMIFSNQKCITKEYWKLKTKEHTDSLEKTAEHIRFLIEDSIKRQLVSDVPLRMFTFRRIRL